MKAIVYLFLFVPALALGQPRSQHTLKDGTILTDKDSIKLLRPPFVFTYPRPNVDDKEQYKRLKYLERTGFHKTYPIHHFYRTKAKSRKLVDVAVLDIDGASATSKSAEFYVELEKAIEANEIQIVKGD